jgi:hypothetical protein
MDNQQRDAISRKRIFFETVEGVSVGAIAAVAGVLTGEILMKSIFARTLRLPVLDAGLKRDAALFGCAGALVGGALRFQSAISNSRESGGREV